MKYFFTFLCLLGSLWAAAQDKDQLFGNGEAKKPRYGFILTGNASADLPGGDMAHRFGNSFRLGPGVMYKTKNNWLIGAKFDFIVGSVIREDSLMANIRDKYPTYSKRLYEFINDDGERVGVPVYERGYAVGISVGKLITWGTQHPDRGLEVLTTVGFMQHRIDIYDRDKNIAAIRGSLVKGYDRLANGSFIEQYAGYMFFSKSRLINFALGADVLVGFTQGRRDWLYDVNRPGTDKRLDILFGLRGSWFIPIFKRQSEDMLFE